MVFISAVPKSGTHLLASVINELYGSYPESVKEKNKIQHLDFSKYKKYPNLVGHYRLEHLLKSESLQNLVRDRKLFIMIRDPRDVANSMVHYLEKSTNQFHMAAAKMLAGMNHEEKVKYVANGFETEDKKFEVLPLDRHCSGFVEIQQLFPKSCIIKYEDFFSSEVVNKMSDFLEIDKVKVQSAISRALVGDSRTKRKGIPNAWEREFSDDLKLFFSSNYSKIINQLGYK